MAFDVHSSRSRVVAKPVGHSRRRATSARGVSVIAALIVSGAAAIVQATSFGCTAARFPYCEKDDDCKDKGTSKLCYDLRCVQCRYDADCGDGRYCDRNVQECKVLDQAGRATAEPSSPPPPADSSNVSPGK